MNRRSFFSLLASALVLDPERVLYVPGKKLISIPKPAPLFITLPTGEWVYVETAWDGQTEIVRANGIELSRRPFTSLPFVIGQWEKHARSTSIGLKHFRLPPFPVYTDHQIGPRRKNDHHSHTRRAG